jgi:hypothetical protein
MIDSRGGLHFRVQQDVRVARKIGVLRELIFFRRLRCAARWISEDARK